MKQSRFTDEQIIGFLKQAYAGISVKELCRSGGFSQKPYISGAPALAARQHGLTAAQLFDWRKAYFGM